MALHKPASATLIICYIVLFVLLVAAIVMGVFASNLNAQVQHELSLTPTPIPAWPDNVLAVTRDPSLPTPEPILRMNSIGKSVVALQTRLQELGYYSGVLDGVFGAGTESAVMRFQEQNQLEMDGMVGPATSALLYSDKALPLSSAVTPGSSAATSPAPSVSPAASGTAAPQYTETAEIQQRLKELGYYTGSVDGITGPATRAAVRIFQQRNGLAADGLVGPATRAMLASAAAVPFTTPAPGSEPWVRSDGLPILVNGDHHLPSTYQYSDLVMLRTYCDSKIVKIKGSEIEGERIAVDALMVMLQAARADGHKGWQVNAGCRSVSYQQELFNEIVSGYENDGLSRSEAIARTRQTVADPGASEHHTGLAFDMAITGETAFGATKQSVWLAQHCWEYGFIIRYPADKTNITGIAHEPWHVRYVGVEHSTRMHQENLCLEEYVEKYGN